jgi:hypothetical protein
LIALLTISQICTWSLFFIYRKIFGYPAFRKLTHFPKKLHFIAQNSRAPKAAPAPTFSKINKKELKARGP